MHPAEPVLYSCCLPEVAVFLKTRYLILLRGSQPYAPVRGSCISDKRHYSIFGQKRCRGNASRTLHIKSKEILITCGCYVCVRYSTGEERIFAVSFLFVFIPLLLFQAKSNESSVDDISSHKNSLFDTGFSFFLPKLESCLSGMNQKGMLKNTLAMAAQCIDSRLPIMIHVEDLVDGPSVLAILW